MVHIDFTILLNSVGNVGKVGAWFNGWHVSNFDMDRVGRVGPQNFGTGQRKLEGRNVCVG